ATAASASTAEAADNQYDDENGNRDPARQGVAALARHLARHAHAFERDAATLRDAANDAFSTGAQSLAVAAVTKVRRHDLAARLAREAVGDPLLQVVADLNLRAALLDREQDQQAVVLPLLPDPFAVVGEQLDDVLPDVAVRFDGR